jgi:hypothetical protein
VSGTAGFGNLRLAVRRQFETEHSSALTQQAQAVEDFDPVGCSFSWLSSSHDLAGGLPHPHLTRVDEVVGRQGTTIQASLPKPKKAAIPAHPDAVLADGYGLNSVLDQERLALNPIKQAVVT